ncbi:hypothetical protein Ahy_A07g032148 [Arachis hypogaea]|uniref:Uncharacterized protein n=1 Tax=Arachis hypogaea TaxID=3818 RepID=A0A445C676_ARAHY|nr:hypothetical protein Ahy_A07g032148 [Arachis hypogaea]
MRAPPRADSSFCSSAYRVLAAKMPCRHSDSNRDALALLPKSSVSTNFTTRRSLGRVSVPVWLIILSDQLLIIALVSYCLTN